MQTTQPPVLPEISAEQISRMRAQATGFPRLVPKDLQVPDTIYGLAALNRTGKHIYGGTVPAHVKARRRARNKAARHARRVHRR